MSRARRITGWVRVRVTGAEPARFLDALGRQGVPFWDAAPPEDFSLTVCVPWRYRERLVPLAESLGCEGTVLAAGGVPALWGNARRRATMGLALLMTLALLCGSLSRIWDIEIEGNERIPDGLILQALADVGVERGARWVGMSQDAVRNAVILRLPGLRWMTVTMEGSRARVIVRERREHIEPVDEGEYARVVADKAGFVTAVVAKRGAAAEVVNKAVLPGETLIQGYATGKWGVQGPVRAIGYARARTWYELTAAAPVDVGEKAYSGAEKTRLSLLLGKKRINFYKGSSICPAGCDKIIKRYTLGREGSFALPVAVEAVTFRAYDTRPAPAAELTEELEARLMEELQGRVGDGEIVETAFSSAEDGGVLYVTLRAECEENIGVPAALTDGEIQEIISKIPKTEDNT